MKATLLNIVSNKWIMAGLFFCGLYQLFLLFVTVSWHDRLGFITASVKTDIALHEYLKPETQRRTMTDLLSRDMSAAMQGDLYDTLIRSDFYKSSGLTIDKPTAASEILPIVLYSSLEEFKKINPNCCYTKIISDSDSCFGKDPTFAGGSARRGYYTCVFIHATLRYLDENDRLIERKNAGTTAVMMTSSGKIVSWEP